MTNEWHFIFWQWFLCQIFTFFVNKSVTWISKIKWPFCFHPISCDFCHYVSWWCNIWYDIKSIWPYVQWNGWFCIHTVVHEYQIPTPYFWAWRPTLSVLHIIRVLSKRLGLAIIRKTARVLQKYLLSASQIYFRVNRAKILPNNKLVSV